MIKKVVLLIFVLVLIMTSCNVVPEDNQGTDAIPKKIDVLDDSQLSGNITVSAYDSFLYKSFLEEAAKAFEAKYPNTSVNIETFAKMPEFKTSTNTSGDTVGVATMEEDTQGATDYINNLSTQLMSGGGADIIAMDYILPYDRYVKNGQLENLSNYIESDDSFNKSDYFANIFDATANNKVNYILPVAYEFEYYSYDKSIANEEFIKAITSKDGISLKDILALVKNNADTIGKDDKLVGMTATELITSLVFENINYFLDSENKTVNFNDGEFQALLESIKILEEKGYIHQDILNFADVTPEELDKWMNDVNKKNLVSKGYAIDLSEDYRAKDDIKMSFASTPGNTENNEFATLKADVDGNVAMNNILSYAMNSNSQNKDVAWAFLKFLLSEEIQISTSLSPVLLPVNNNARLKKAELVLSGEGFGGFSMTVGASSGNDSDEFTAELPPIDEENSAEGGAPSLPEGEDGSTGEINSIVDGENPPVIEDDPSAKSDSPYGFKEVDPEKLVEYQNLIESLSAKLNHYNAPNYAVSKLIEEESKKFFSGSQTSEQSAKAIQDKLTLYLNE